MPDLDAAELNSRIAGGRLFAGLIGRLRWRLNRLRCMSLAEVGHRLRRAVAARVERYELPADPNFQQQFMLAMNFPHMSEPFPHVAHLIPNRTIDPLAEKFGGGKK